MKMMPACSTRSTAVRATLSMSISFCSSSCVRYSSASGTFSCRFLVFALKQPGQHVLQIDVDLFDRRPGDDLERGKGLLAHVDFDDPRVEAAGAQLLAEPLARLMLLIARGRRILVWRDRTRRRQQDIEQPLLGVLRRLRADLLEALLADHVDAELHEVADHRFHVAADVADFGELRRFDLDERRLRESREPARDLGLADAGRADHQDVLRRDFFGELRRQLLPPHAVAQRDRHGALGGGLADRRTCRARRRSAAASARRSDVWVVSGRIDGHYSSSTTMFALV